MDAADKWQLLIGLLALLDAAYLFYKLKTHRADAGIISAILPRAYIGGLYLVDGMIKRSDMEPIRTLVFFGIAILFITADVNHIAEWYRKQ